MNCLVTTDKLTEHINFYSKVVGLKLFIMLIVIRKGKYRFVACMSQEKYLQM